MKAIMVYLSAAGFCLLLISTTSIQKAPVKEPVYPGKTWERRTPENAGLNHESLSRIDQLMKKAHANGALIKDGYLIKEWNFDGPSDKKIEVQSVSKSITGLMLGLAIKEGKVPDADAIVKQYYPAFEGGAFAEQITFRHLVTATSGLPSMQNKERYLHPENTPPGRGSHYHNDHTALLSRALTYLYGESLLDVLRREVLTKIGAELDWGTQGTVVAANGKTIPVVAGFAYNNWTATDLARIGWLYVNEGKWKGEQLLPKTFIRETLTAVSVPVYNFRAGSEMKKMENTAYGYAWWGSYTPSGRLIWRMDGNGGQFCIIVPDAGVVFTKINGIDKNYQPFVGYADFENDLLKLIGKR